MKHKIFQQYCYFFFLMNIHRLKIIEKHTQEILYLILCLDDFLIKNTHGNETRTQQTPLETKSESL